MTMIRTRLAGTILVAAGLLLVAAAPVFAADGCPDAWITTKITTRFMGGTGWSLFHINVDTEECVVTLSGCVKSNEHRAYALEQASKVKKVRQVIDQLTICPSDSEDDKPAKRHHDDAEGVDDCADAVITAEVKSTLLENDGLQAFDIDVETEQCRVTLAGCVDTPRQRKKAVKLANQAEGVRGVHSELNLCSAG